MPAHLRNELGILQIHKICKVERDLPFLFRKNWNQQFLPIIAVIFTIYSLNVANFWVKVSLLCIIIPLSSYVTLSRVREKVPKKRRK